MKIALYFAVPKGKNSDVITGIDKLMENMLSNKNSFYSLTYQKWTIPRQSVKFPVWIWWILFGLLALGFFLLLWNFILNKQIALKTSHLKAEIAERKLADKKIKQSLNEKVTLIHELYHRTKNNMMEIQSLIKLQAEEYPDNKEFQQLVKKTEDRIHAISLVHQMLYKSKDLSHINIKDYINQLATLIFKSYDINENLISLNIDINVSNQFFILDTAIPFGLILNELITNSLIHAFVDNRKGEISISFFKQGIDNYIMKYSDNGIGVHDGFDFRNQNSLGLKLIHSIIEFQMNGKISFKNNNGISCVVKIPSAYFENEI